MARCLVHLVCLCLNGYFVSHRRGHYYFDVFFHLFTQLELINLFNSRQSIDSVRDVYPNFVLSLLSKLLIDGDNAPLYQSLIESGYALDWIAPVCGMEQGARTTSFHVGVQGVRLEDLDQFSDRVKDILADVVR